MRESGTSMSGGVLLACDEFDALMSIAADWLDDDGPNGPNGFPSTAEQVERIIAAHGVRSNARPTLTGKGIEGLTFDEHGTAFITEDEWRERFLPVAHLTDEGWEPEWVSDDPDDDAFVRTQDPERVWTQALSGEVNVIYNGYLDIDLSDWRYITLVPCPEHLDVQVRDDARRLTEECAGR